MKQTQNSEPRTQNGNVRTLTKKDIVEHLHTKTGFSRQAMLEMVTAIFSILKEDLLNGEGAKIANFGVWKVRKKKPRPGRNMKTGETMEISARSVVSFKPSQKLRDIMNEK